MKSKKPKMIKAKVEPAFKMSKPAAGKMPSMGLGEMAIKKRKKK